MFLRAFLLLLLTCVVHACSTAHYPPAQATLTGDQSTYVLNTGDRVKVTVFDEADISGTYRVDSRGMIALPFIGKTAVSNQTEQQAAQTIASSLQKNGFLKHPKVSVETIDMRPFYVLGEVEKGGQFAFQSGLTVYQAVAIAGGYSYRADRDDITIRRQTGKGTGTEKRFSAHEDAPVLPGDVIEIGERFF